MSTSEYGLVTGRVSAIALDPSDASGNHLYVGTTGGGVWLASNAATGNASNVTFTALTDQVGALTNAVDSSLSIGALSVQPGGTGVILAGTGDPNDGLDSYYGAGILRSMDGGTTWNLIQTAVDGTHGFVGEGFAGFAWSTANPQLVVAAVSQAWDGVLVDAVRPNLSFQGLYYSTDSGATWSLARITDQNGKDVQGPLDGYGSGDGNAATAVVWNPKRNIFVAAVRFHGYYQSSDGVVWTRMAAQPGANLTTVLCPTNSNSIGSIACPIFRGALAVNPQTGDTFAWTVDANRQDQGIWQDACALSGGSCSNPAVSFTKQWNSAALETNTWQGAATIANGDYDLALAAIPSGQDTLLLAGGEDLWRCSLAMGCAWRNTTNAFTCMSAGVAPYQHALEWNQANPLEVFAGNDSGLWRSMDSIGETGPACAASDAGHFQSLNAGLGSLAEVDSVSAPGDTPYNMMLGLGANGTAGVKGTGPVSAWPQILGGEGGPVAIDPTDATRWYVNNGAGVSIHLCAKAGACTPADFGANPAVGNANVGGDGLTMSTPAPFVVDPADSNQLLIGTCRVWRGPVRGTGWTTANAVSPMFDGNLAKSSCSGNALVRSLAAQKLSGGGEVVYAGIYGVLDGGGTRAGHVFSATMNSSGTWSAWQDLALNPVTNDTAHGFNINGFDISSLTIDSHDATGNTVYATVEGMPGMGIAVQTVYRSIDGGGHWVSLRSNLPAAPANAIAVDPQDANTVYVAQDTGVYATRSASTCANAAANCWFSMGTGLPQAPVTGLSASPVTSSSSMLAAATYGRGVWLIPLLSAGPQTSSVTANPKSLAFGTQAWGTTSASQAVVLTNIGAVAFVAGQVTMSGDFSETDNCAGATVNVGASCTLQVAFTPSKAGSRAGLLTIGGNVTGGTISVSLTGTGGPAPVVNLSPVSINFGTVKVGAASTALQVTAENGSAAAVPIASLTVSGPFALTANACGATALAPNSDCSLQIKFQPTVRGPATGTLTLVDSAGTQTVQLTGTGAAPPTGTLSASSLSFAATIVGQSSVAQTVTLTNSGDLPLTAIATSASGPFQVTSNCTTQLAAGATCSLSVVFTPTAAGAASGILTESDLVNTAQAVALSGTGLLPPAFAVSPGSLNFPARPVATASAPLTLTVSNSGGASMANVGFGITGAAAGSFSMGTSSCGASLAPGASCTVPVIFTPATAGGAAATLTLSSSTAGVKALSVPLTGIGQAAGINVSPPRLNFAAQALGQASAAQTVTISNSGNLAAAGLAVAMSGPFSLSQNTCGTTLAAGASCATGVVFTPSSRGVLTGTLTVNSSNVAPAATVALSGIGGLTGAVTITPALVSFPQTGVGTTSNPVTLTLSNAASGVALGNLNVTGSAGFKVGSNTCGTTLAAGASCTVAVAFAPTASGAQNGTLSVASSALAQPATVPLWGTGYDFTAVASGQSSQTVASGQSASYSLSLAPVTGLGGTFSFQCGTLPAYAACVFNPSSETLAAGTTGTATLKITTSQAQAALAVPEGGFPWGRSGILAGVLMLPLIGLKRRRLSGAAVVLVLCMALASCSSSGGGGGGTAPPMTHSTPAGTYAITVTVTSGGVQHDVNLTLVVD